MIEKIMFNKKDYNHNIRKYFIFISCSLILISVFQAVFYKTVSALAISGFMLFSAFYVIYTNISIKHECKSYRFFIKDKWIPCMEKFEDNKVYHYEINRLDSIKEKKLYFILYGDFAEKQIDDDKYIVDEKDVEELIVFKGVSNVKELRKFFNFYKGARHAYQKINN